MSVIGGRARISGNFLQEIKRLYLSQHQISLPIKRVQLKSLEHPIIKSITNQFNQDIVIEKVDFISKQMMTFLLILVESFLSRAMKKFSCNHQLKRS